MRRILALCLLVLTISLLPARAADQKDGKKLEMFTGMVTSYKPETEITVAKKKSKLTCALADTPMKGAPKQGDVVTVTYEEVNGKKMCRSIVVKQIMPRSEGGVSAGR